MTNEEARAFIRQFCANVDEGLEELKQLDEAVGRAQAVLADTIAARLAERRKDVTE